MSNSIQTTTGQTAPCLQQKIDKTRYLVEVHFSDKSTQSTYSNILNLMPTKIAAAYTGLTKYEVFHILGLKIPYPAMLILVALLVSVITLSFAYRAFHKHQVT